MTYKRMLKIVSATFFSLCFLSWINASFSSFVIIHHKKNFAFSIDKSENWLLVGCLCVCVGFEIEFILTSSWNFYVYELMQKHFGILRCCCCCFLFHQNQFINEAFNVLSWSKKINSSDNFMESLTFFYLYFRNVLIILFSVCTIQCIILFTFLSESRCC